MMETRLSPVGKKGQVRNICDPRIDTNARAHSRRQPLLAVPSIPSIVRRILFRKRGYPGMPILLAKRDVMAAFKLILLAIRTLARAGFRAGRFIMTYLSMYFGWKGFPGTWGAIPTSTLQYIAKRARRRRRVMGMRVSELLNSRARGFR